MVDRYVESTAIQKTIVKLTASKLDELRLFSPGGFCPGILSLIILAIFVILLNDKECQCHAELSISIGYCKSFCLWRYVTPNCTV